MELRAYLGKKLTTADSNRGIPLDTAILSVHPSTQQFLTPRAPSISSFAAPRDAMTAFIAALPWTVDVCRSRHSIQPRTRAVPALERRRCLLLRASVVHPDSNPQSKNAATHRTPYDGRPWYAAAFSVRGRAFPAVQILSCVGVASAVLTISAMTGRPLVLPQLAHRLLGSPLGFLLVFRLNQAHSRWRSAYDLLASFRSTCEDLATMASTWLPEDVTKHTIALVQIYLKSVEECITDRKPVDVSQEVLSFIPAADIARIHVEPVSRRPVVIAGLLRVAMKPADGSVNAIAAQLDRRVADLINLRTQVCQLQSVDTVNSLSYSLHLNSMLLLFLYTLPPVCTFALCPSSLINCLPSSNANNCGRLCTSMIFFRTSSAWSVTRPGKSSPSRLYCYSP
jgi:predicted membrane chloride channel (bestrophin family)